MKKFIFLFFSVLLLSGCAIGGTWTGYYYRDIDRMDDETTWVIQPGFKNLEECRDWVDSIADPKENYDYECGLNCRYREEYGMNVCEKTEQ